MLYLYLLYNYRMFSGSYDIVKVVTELNVIVKTFSKGIHCRNDYLTNEFIYRLRRCAFIDL